MTDPIDLVSSKLRRLTPTGDRSWKACCPAHEDKNPSLSVSVGDDGRVLLKCFAGCDVEEVLRALDLESRDLFRQHTNHQRPKPLEQVRPKPRPTPRLSSLASVQDSYAASLGKPNTIWHYQDSDGETVGATFRWDKPDGSKEIRPGWRFPDGWSQSIPAVRPLFQLPQVLNEPDRVFVAEGEKAAAAITSLGFTATTSPGGSKAAERADWSSIQSETVVILPDADMPGQEYADDVRCCLLKASFKGDIVVIALPGLRPGSGEDAVEWIERVHTDDLIAAARALEQLSREAAAKIRRRRPILTITEILTDPAWDAPPEVLHSGVRFFDSAQPFGGLERGSKTILAAPPRCFKTTLMLYLAWQFATAGHRVRFLAGEGSRTILSRRIVAMHARVSPAVIAQPASLQDTQARDRAMKAIQNLGDRLEFQIRPFTIDDVSEACEVADVVFLDYLHLIEAPPGSANLGSVERLEHAMSGILTATQHGKAAFITAAAMNRANRGDQSLSSLRGSSAIEYGADAVFIGTEESMAITEAGDRRSVSFGCLKQREGEPRPLEFDVAVKLGPLPLDPMDD